MDCYRSDIPARLTILVLISQNEYFRVNCYPIKPTSSKRIIDPRSSGKAGGRFDTQRNGAIKLEAAKSLCNNNGLIVEWRSKHDSRVGCGGALGATRLDELWVVF